MRREKVRRLIYLNSRMTFRAMRTYDSRTLYDASSMWYGQASIVLSNAQHGKTFQIFGEAAYTKNSRFEPLSWTLVQPSSRTTASRDWRVSTSALRYPRISQWLLTTGINFSFIGEVVISEFVIYVYCDGWYCMHLFIHAQKSLTWWLEATVDFLTHVVCISASVLWALHT